MRSVPEPQFLSRLQRWSLFLSLPRPRGLSLEAKVYQRFAPQIADSRPFRPSPGHPHRPATPIAHSPHRIRPTAFAVSPSAASFARHLAALSRSITAFLSMNYRIIGTTLPVLELQLNPGDGVFAVSGELSWMNSAITMNTTTQFGGGGGFFGALKRIAGGGSLFMTDYRAEGGEGLLAFASRVPGSILFVELSPTETYLIHRHGFLCATHGVELNVAFQQSLGAGIFGGDGFLLQKVSGTGHAWIELDGEVVTYDLKPGETMRVHPGHVGMFQESVGFQITRVPGIKNMLFGGDGIFLAALTGPGRIWLQSLPLSNLAHALQPYLPRTVERVEDAGAGAVIGSVIRGLTK